MQKILNNKAWFMVLPVLMIVALNAVVPLMTVVNYSVQDTFGNNVFFFEGTRWFNEVLASERFHGALLTPVLPHRAPSWPLRYRSAWRSRSPCRARASGPRSAWC